MNTASAQADLTENGTPVINTLSAKGGIFRVSTFAFGGLFICRFVTIHI